MSVSWDHSSSVPNNLQHIFLESATRPHLKPPNVHLLLRSMKVTTHLHWSKYYTSLLVCVCVQGERAYVFMFDISQCLCVFLGQYVLETKSAWGWDYTCIFGFPMETVCEYVCVRECLINIQCLSVCLGELAEVREMDSHSLGGCGWNATTRVGAPQHLIHWITNSIGPQASINTNPIFISLW